MRAHSNQASFKLIEDGFVLSTESLHVRPTALLSGEYREKRRNFGCLQRWRLLLFMPALVRFVSSFL